MSIRYRIHLGCTLLLLLASTAGYSRDVEAPISDRVAFSQVIAQVRVIETGNAPEGRFRRIAKAQVVLPIKGAERGQFVTFDYDNGLLCPNVLYSANEECLVFLTQQSNGRLMTCNHSYGKYIVKDDLVKGWSVKRYSHRDTPLKRVIAQIRGHIQKPAKRSVRTRLLSNG